MRIGLLTSGGDCPGLNAVIRAVVRRCSADGVGVVGFRDAWRGVIERDWFDVGVEDCRGILPRGGTILGTSRVSAARTPEGIAAARSIADELGLDGYIVVGGDGSLSGAAALQTAGVNVVGVPKTIDNDIGSTEMTFGFDTAVQVATFAIDRLHTTAESHDRLMVLEVMGRHVGHIAVRSGLAGGAAAVLVPEEPFDIEEVAKRIRERHSTKRRYSSIIVVAEGAIPVPGTLSLPAPVTDEWGHVRLGGIGQVVSSALASLTGFDSRVTELGYVQRGGTPTAFDRVLATRFGVAAADAAIDGAWGDMVALQCDAIVRVPLSEAISEPRPVDPALLRTLRFFARK
jgi:6-phosphofructokinase 1